MRNFINDQLWSSHVLSDEDMRAWNSPAHWVSLQPVLKPEYETISTGLVTKTGGLTDKNGSILMKGSYLLSDQRAVVSQWRCYEHALSTDVTKAYYSMRTGDLEMHIERITWRYGKTDQK